MAEAENKPNFSGCYKLAKSENFEEFLAANGAPWMARKMASKISPTVNITHQGEEFDIQTSTLIRTQVDKFTIGTPYEMSSMRGDKMTATPSWDGNAVQIEFKPASGEGKPYTARRQILEDGQLLLTMSVADVESKRWFQKQ